MINFLKNILKVNGSYNLKRLLALLLALVVTTSWIAQQFFSLNVPEFMFRLLVDLLKTAIEDFNN